jgi:uncharacterized protein (TIGR00251 family)
MQQLRITTTSGGVRFAIRVQPRASRTEVTGLHGDALRIRVNAPPVDGAANEAVVRTLAETLDVSPRSVSIVAGASSRTKIVEITGLTEAEVRRRMSQCLNSLGQP